jgi:hypothetical protein
MIKNLFCLSISLLILSTSRNFLLFDLFDQRIYFLYLFFTSSILFLFLTKFQFYKNNLLIYEIFKFKIETKDIIFYILILTIILSGLYNKNNNSIIFGIFFLFITQLLNKCSFLDLKKIVNFTCIILGITCFLNIINFFLYYILDNNINALFVRSISTFYSNFNYSNLAWYLGGVDAFLNKIVSEKLYYFPRFVGYVDQGSAIPAVILLTAAISIYMNKKLLVFPGVMIFSSLFSFAGSVIFFFFGSLIFFLIFFFYNKKKIFWLNPMIFLYIIYFFFIFFFIFTILYQELMQSLINDFTFNDIFLRTVSGRARLFIIINSNLNFYENFLFGTNLRFIGFGQIFVSYGNNFGVFSFVCIFIIIFKILRDLISKFNNIENNLWIILSIAFIFSLFSQFILYNDYAMSRMWGLIFIYILHKINLFNLNIK